MDRLSDALRDRVEGIDTEKVETASIAVLTFIFIAVLLTWPLATQMTTHIIAEPAQTDAQQYIVLIDHFREVLQGGADPFHLTRMCHPDGVAPGQQSFNLPLTLTGAAVSLVTGSGLITTYNAIMLLFIAMSGLAAYLFTREFVDSTPACLLAGGLYMLAPTMIHAVGWGLRSLQLLWVPLIFLYLHRTLEAPTWRSAVMLAVVNILQFLASSQFTAYLTVLLPLYAIVYLAHRPDHLTTDLINRLGGAVAIFLTVAVPYFRTFVVGGSSSMASIETLRWGTLYSPWLQLVNGTVLLLIGAYLYRERWYALVPVLAVGAVSYVLSFGPYLPLAPYQFLYLSEAVPLFGYFETAQVMLAFTYLAMAAGLAAGMDRFMTDDIDIISLMMVTAAILLAFSVIPGEDYYGTEIRDIPLYEPRDYAAYDAIQQEGASSVVWYPRGHNPQYVYSTLHTGRPVVNCGSSFVPPATKEFGESCGYLGFALDGQCMAKARSFGVSHLILDVEFYDRYLSQNLETRQCTQRLSQYLGTHGAADISSRTIQQCCTGESNACTQAIVDIAAASPYTTELEDGVGRENPEIRAFRLNYSAVPD